MKLCRVFKSGSFKVVLERLMGGEFKNYKIKIRYKVRRRYVYVNLHTVSNESMRIL